MHVILSIGPQDGNHPVGVRKRDARGNVPLFQGLDFEPHLWIDLLRSGTFTETPLTLLGLGTGWISIMPFFLGLAVVIPVLGHACEELERRFEGAGHVHARHRGQRLPQRGELPGDALVTTVMANLGFKLAMKREGLTVVETAVGDRYVLEAMKAGGFTLGGEQSGHLILSDHGTTGDGLLTALQLLSRMASTERSLAELAGVMQRLVGETRDALAAMRCYLAG